MTKTLRIGDSSVEVALLDSKGLTQFHRAFIVSMGIAIREAHGEMTVAGILQRIQNGTLQPIAIAVGGSINAFMVVEKVQYECLSALRVILLQGVHMEEWVMEVSTFLRVYAKSVGCKRVEYLGRKGWVKILRQLGWQEAYVSMNLEVDEDG